MLLLFLMFTGCFSPVEVQKYDLKPQPHVSEKVKVVLDRYVDGMPVASEITLFPGFISDMKEMDPANHELIKQLYQDLQDNPDDAAELASEALKKLVIPEKEVSAEQVDNS